MLLDLQGYDVRVARDGPATLQEAEEFLPHMILLDLSMPRMDGYETATAIRTAAWGKPIYVVAVTGHSQPADRQRAERAGIDLFLVKPIEVAELERLCQQVAARVQNA
jgi:CheY-like chemotaxis protein